MTQSDQLLLSLFAQTGDAICVFDANNKLIHYNQAWLRLVQIPEVTLHHIDFDEMIRYCHRHHVGLKIDGDDLDAWLSRAHQKRRSLTNRLFEVDTLDGRFWLCSEYTNPDGVLLAHFAEISKQKLLEFNLKKQQDELTWLAMTDQLTQVYNRHGLFSKVHDSMQQCHLQQRNYSFFLIDVDFFKEINDNFGHTCGDEALSAIASALKGQLRNQDLLGRIGGEEFAILLTEVSASQANHIGERLCHAVAQLPPVSPKQRQPLTISVGVVHHQAGEQIRDFNALYKTADQALYQAKHQGRNQMVVAPPSTDPPTTAQYSA